LSIKRVISKLYTRYPFHLFCSSNQTNTSLTRFVAQYNSRPVPALPWLYTEADFVAIKKQEGVARTKVVLDIYDHTHLNSDHKYT
jgi:hypothetical protein